MFRIIGLLLVLLVVVFGASFAYQNYELVTVDLWTRKFEVLLPWVVFSSLIGGWVLGVLSVSGIIVRQLREVRRLRRAVRLAETEVANLRSIPIRNAH
jgi:putative membrane protein